MEMDDDSLRAYRCDYKIEEFKKEWDATLSYLNIASYAVYYSTHGVTDNGRKWMINVKDLFIWFRKNRSDHIID